MSVREFVSEAPDKLLASLKAFLAAYREAAHKPGPDAPRFAS